MDRSWGLEGVYLYLIVFKSARLHLIFLKYGRSLSGSDELFVFVMSSMSRKQQILQPFEDTLSVTSQCSIFHELECVGTVHKVVQDSWKALQANGCFPIPGCRGRCTWCMCTCL